jgi:hypothetical protein
MNLGKSQMPKEGTAEALQTFTLPYREPNGSLLRFLNGTKTHCIRHTQHIHIDNISSNRYMRGILPKHTDFNCYVYASHASDVDTRKSITGYIRFMISGDPISWQSRIQRSVALSSIMEAESMAASAKTQEAM